jgi:hypothetical protein
LLCAGLTAAATAAAVATAAPAAFAADVAVTLTPASGGLTGTLQINGTNVFNSVPSPVGYFIPSGSCGATYATSTPPATLATIVRTDNNSGTAAIGTGAAALSFDSGAPRTYTLCLYAGTGSGAIAGHGSYTLTWSASNTGGPQGGTVALTSPTTFKDMTTLGAYFVATGTACAATYTTTGVTAGTVARNSDDQVTVTVPTSLALNSNAAKLYNLCVYNGTANTSTLQIASTYQVAPSATTVSPVSGASGGGNTVTVTYPTASSIFTTVQTYYAGFATGGCPSSYTNVPTARRSPTVTRVSATQATAVVPSGVGGANNQVFNVCFYSSNTGDNLVGTSSLTAYSTTISSSTLGSTVGAGSNITVNVTSSNANAFTNAATPAAVFFPQNGTTQYCPGSYLTTGGTAAQGARKASNTKASVQFPATSLDAGPYSVCVYTSNDAATSKLAALATYTVAPVPTLSTVSPASGPALGGNTVTVSGANLPTAASNIQVTIGNIAVAAAKVTAGDATYFTFVAPPHSKGAVDVVVKTDIATATLMGAYTYVNSLSLATNTAPNTNSLVTLDIYGAGFNDYTFSSTANTGAHVYLVHGRYDGTLLAGSSGTSAKERTNADVIQDCASVWVVDDTELLCNLDLTKSMTTIGTQTGYSGTRSLTLIGTTTSLIVTSGTAPTGSTAGTPVFTQADVGKTVATTSSKIAADTYITKVIDGYTAVLNQPPLDTNSGSVQIGFSDAARTVNSASSGATTLTAASGAPFDSSYIGHLIAETSGADIPSPTYITGVNSAGTTITLSQALTGTVTSVDITSSNAVRPGAYSVQIVSDATPGSATNTSSAISSGSTFTVAAF